MRVDDQGACLCVVRQQQPSNTVSDDRGEMCVCMVREVLFVNVFICVDSWVEMCVN